MIHAMPTRSSVVLLAFLCLSLSACGDKGAKPDATSSADGA